MHNVRMDMENLVIGTDWFLCYTESDYYVQISEWVAVDSENKMQQIVEMMNVLKKYLSKIKVNYLKLI